MSNFWNELESGLQTAVEECEKAGRKAVTKTRRAMKEAELRRTLRDKYADLGRLVYDARGQEALDEEEVTNLCISIGAIREALEELEETKSAEKKYKICACGRKNDKDAAFCQGCGGKL